MPVFYIPQLSLGLNYPGPEESHHCIRVSRLKAGSRVRAIDGKGNLGTGHVRNTDPKHCSIQIDRLFSGYHQRPYRLHIAIAPTKSMDRFEWFLEKATEIGIDEITPILCQHSERKIVKLPRLQKVILSAMKQSLNAFQPQLNDLTPFKKVIHQNLPENSFIAHTGEGPRTLFQQSLVPGGKTFILIGPEGDFTEEEIVLSENAGIRPVSLGESRYRTETAGIIACHTVRLLNH